MFHFRHKTQHGPGGEPSAVDPHGLDVRPDTFRDRGAGTVGPRDLYTGMTEKKKKTSVKLQTNRTKRFKIQKKKKSFPVDVG